MKQKRLIHNLTYIDIAKEAGVRPGSVYAVELGANNNEDEKKAVLAALNRLIARVDTSAQETIHIEKVGERWTKRP